MAQICFIHCEGKVTVSFDSQRHNMIESQVRVNDVSDLSLIDAISNTKREDFVAENQINFAYAEIETISKSGRKLMKARDFSKLAQISKIDSNNDILVIAGSAGYSASIFKAMKTNVSIVDNINCEFAGINCINTNLETLNGIEDNSFDVIFVDGGVETIPSSWAKKLKNGGRMALIHYESSVGVAKVFVKANEIIASKSYFEAKPPKLNEFSKKQEFSL